MGRYSLALDELGPHMEEQAPGVLAESRIEPVLDWDDWRGEGRLVESFLERVVVVTLNHDTLALSDISAMRRAMVRAQARRAILYVPLQTAISNPVMLLATLSKIQILRLAPTDSRT